MVFVVLYAEGAGEDSGETTMWPAPGHALQEEHLGSAHILVRRAIEHATKVPPAAVRFVSPSRVRARRARGSDLTDLRTVREILTWIPSPNRLRPQLAVVLVDEDGVADRGRRLRDATNDPDLLPHVVAVAVREFESWLLADSDAVAAVAGQPLPSKQAVEDMAPGAAKTALNQVLGAEASRFARREIAARSDLAVLAQLRSFGTFLHDLADARP